METYLSDLGRWLGDWRIAINVSKSSAMISPRPVDASRNPEQYSSSGSQFSGPTTPVILGWPLINGSPGRKISIRWERVGTLGSLLNRRSSLSIKNGVVLYKQLIRPMMYYACPVWRFTARSHFNKLQVLQSKCLRISTSAPWYTGNRQIHDDLGVPYFSDHIRSLTERFDSKLACVGNT